METTTKDRQFELMSMTPATLRAVAMRLGKAFAKPRTVAERREVIAWILDREAAK